MADQFNPIIKAYRKGETIPLKLDRSELVGMLNAINVGLANGMPKIGADNFGDKVLLEGRADAGANDFNYNNKRALNLAGTVTSTLPENRSSGATYVGAVMDKSDVATRLNIPFERAWNGTGKSKDTGRTGQQHSDRAAQMQGAIDDPRNKEFKDLITRGVSGELSPTEQASQVSHDTLRRTFAGLNSENRLTVEGKYTDQALSGIAANIEDKIKAAKLSYPREVAVRQDMKSPAAVLNALPEMWQNAAGIPTKGLSGLDLSNASPDTIAILNSIIGNN